MLPELQELWLQIRSNAKSQPGGANDYTKRIMHEHRLPTGLSALCNTSITSGSTCHSLQDDPYEDSITIAMGRSGCAEALENSRIAYWIVRSSCLPGSQANGTLSSSTIF